MPDRSHTSVGTIGNTVLASTRHVLQTRGANDSWPSLSRSKTCLQRFHTLIPTVPLEDRFLPWAHCCAAPQTYGRICLFVVDTYSTRGVGGSFVLPAAKPYFQQHSPREKIHHLNENHYHALRLFAPEHPPFTWHARTEVCRVSITYVTLRSTETRSYHETASR